MKFLPFRLMYHQDNIISSHVHADAEQKTKDKEYLIGLIG